MKQLLVLLFLFISIYCCAQPSDFILLKKNNRTVSTYFAGGTINFTSVSGTYIEANITSIKKDTLFLQEYIVRQVPTQLGVYVLDTSFYYDQYHYNQIKAIGRTGRHFDLGGSGAALMGGGILLTVASGVVYLADNKNFSPKLLGAAVGLFGVGYLLSKVSGKGIVIGKKYSFVYVKASDNKKG
jgi:hypothetical protein